LKSPATTQMNAIKHMQCMEVWGGNRPVDSGVIMPGVDAWVYSQPCENQAAGGDVHYVSTCCGGKVVRMVVADISGHGAGVAETGAHLRLLMRRFINHQNQLNVVRSLNREFTAASAKGVFATAIVMTFESAGNRLVVSNAGHPPPLWYQARRRRWTLLQPQTAAEAGGIPWGIDDESNYQQFRSSLSVGDIILCYTDSLAESKGADGELLGADGLLRIVSGIGNVNPSQLIPRLLSELARCDPSYATRDDVTCLAFRPNGLRPSVPLRDLLLAPIRWAMASTGMKFGYAGWKRDPWDAPIETSAE
jgi:sigma-B regulation protein RsbU (phosphoserine phosphatase)